MHHHYQVGACQPWWKLLGFMDMWGTGVPQYTTGHKTETKVNRWGFLAFKRISPLQGFVCSFHFAQISTVCSTHAVTLYTLEDAEPVEDGAHLEYSRCKSTDWEEFEGNSSYRGKVGYFYLRPPHRLLNMRHIDIAKHTHTVFLFLMWSVCS